MLKLYDGGAYLVNGTEIITDEAEVKAKTGREVSKEEARTQTMAYGILEAHNISDNMERLQIKFDKLTSHDITFVGIIQTRGSITVIWHLKRTAWQSASRKKTENMSPAGSFTMRWIRS